MWWNSGTATMLTPCIKGICLDSRTTPTAATAVHFPLLGEHETPPPALPNDRMPSRSYALEMRKYVRRGSTHDGQDVDMVVSDFKRVEC
jgi:hypothetical protein